ncbi:MAG TPA: lipase maturation factor family protein [Myxococcota bacterium]|nr:lipase maturation factor family protein [Myxococcota bacterium]
METWFGDVWLVRLLVQRGLAAIYLIAFLCAFEQFPALLGERGLLPVPSYLARVGFRDAPSLFHLHYSDRFLRGVAALGIALALVALFGLSEAGPLWRSIAVWLLLWVLYLSIVNVGQTFYGFGWESMLLEAGFFAVFLGPCGSSPSLIPVLALRWMLFRVELGAGLIKLRHDRCWRDLTCLYYHHETQPMPNPLSADFHRLPRLVQHASVAFSHVVQIAVPFGLFAPQPIAAASGCLIIVHQLALIASGNYSWLNWLTAILGFTAFSDSTLRAITTAIASPSLAPRPPIFDAVLYVLASATALLSIQPALNLCSKRQKMNYSYNPLHLVGSYGAFGSVTRRRYEIVVEGTEAEVLSATTEWREYEFRGKPGDVRRRPRQWAPYHLRLDWLMWFLPLSVGVIEDRHQLSILGHERWFVRFAEKLLEADPTTLALLRSDPFHGRRPRFVRAGFYRYRFTERSRRRVTGFWWERTYVGDYLQPRALSE